MASKYAKQLLQVASSIQDSARELNLTPVLLAIPLPPDYDEVTLFDSLITETVLRDTTRQLFLDGYYALSVEEAFKCLNNVVKSRSGITADGAGLMRTVFSLKNPILKINALKTVSQHDQQLGYMDIFAGCMTGIRNPRAHEHRYLDEPYVALELLALANHLLRMVNNAKRSHRRATTSSTS